MSALAIAWRPRLNGSPARRILSAALRGKPRGYKDLDRWRRSYGAAQAGSDARLIRTQEWGTPRVAPKGKRTR